MNIPYALAQGEREGQGPGQGHRHGRHAGRMAHGVNALGLLHDEAVQQELALSPEQTDKVHELLTQV
ncbi:MAG TPA: hypothetical protein VHX68_20460, partial [Planctomycetaceae bacterium]|nr:hypothetical protein [Planctomycetaceae bacterium]